MISILPKVQQFLDSDDIDGAREEVAKISINLEKIDANVRDFAALLALGSQKGLEIGLGVLGRQLLKKDKEVNIDVIWLLLAAILSRQNITADSPSRVSILGLISCVENWELPIFALLTPALDSFFKVSLDQENPLIAEQTLDFIATWGESYAKAPHSKIQLKYFNTLTNSVLDKVDDLELKEEWTEGLDVFFQIADKIKYADENIWSAGKNLVKQIYTPQILKSETGLNDSKVKDNILRFITSSLAAIETIFSPNGLSVAVHIDNSQKKKNWSVVASAVDKVEQLFQEVADIIFDKIVKLPTFTPEQATPGSWTIILNIDLKSERSQLLAKAITSLALTTDEDNEQNSFIINSWQDCVAKLKEDNLTVNLAVSTNIPELYFLHSISTEDTPDIEEPLEPNIRLFSGDVPQADNLERVLDFSSLLLQYPSSIATVQQKFLEINGITDRQFSFYRKAVEILALLDERGRPTNSCFMLNRLPNLEAKMRFLAYQFISSNVGSAWFKWQNANDLSEIQIDRATEFLIAVCPALSEITAKRRAQTLQSWLKIFLKYW